MSEVIEPFLMLLIGKETKKQSKGNRRLIVGVTAALSHHEVIYNILEGSDMKSFCRCGHQV